MRGRILVLCPYPSGTAAGQRFKYEPYIEDWRAAGWEVTVSSFMGQGMWRVLYRPGYRAIKLAGLVAGYVRRVGDLLRIGRFDLVYVFMWGTPLGLPWYERALRARARALVYDVEDNLILGYEPGVEGHPNPWLRFVKGARKPRYLVTNADVVIVASPHNVESMQAVNTVGRVACIPPSLDTVRICPAPPGTFPRAKPVIGWTGTFSSRAYLDMIAEPLRELARRMPFIFRVIGNFDYALDGVDVEIVHWSAEREAADLQSLDIGIYPVPDDAWTRGKAGLKIIQYHAAGLACVASDIPLSRQQIRDGESGFLVRSPDQWVDRLEELLRDPALRRRMGEAGRADALARYSRGVIAPAYRAVLEQVCLQA